MISEKELEVLRYVPDDYISIEELSRKLGKDYYEVYRIIGFLNMKGLVELKEQEKTIIKLGELGKKYIEIGLPETRLYNILKDKKGLSLDEVKSLLGDEANIAIGELKKQGVINIMNGKIILVSENFKPKDYLLKKVETGELSEEELKYLKKRRNLINITKKKIYFVRITNKGKEVLTQFSGKKFIDVYSKEVFEQKLWKTLEFRPIDVKVPVKPRKYGKKHEYLELLDEMRDFLVSMGFKEMDKYSMITSHFWNFEALFIPQDHPAGELSLTDIFALEGELEDYDYDLYERVKKTHIKYFGKWDDKIPKTPMLISHVTAISARTLENLEIPSRYFIIEKVFRYDTIDKKHFIEFSQLEGIVADESLTFRDLLGILKELISSVVGSSKIKFYPAYFPFTEPSVEAYVKHPQLGWMEVGGAGIFREELLEPFNINVPVIAWGLGIDRLAMIKLGIDDIRDLHTRRLK